MNQPDVTPGTKDAPPPAPQPTFDAMPLGTDVRRAIDAVGYTHPTPVQLAVFEPASRGKNLVVQARTGTGKTAAFGLPILDALVRKSQPNVQALILTPTRELAIQVARELEQLAQFRGTKILPIYGGAPMGRQIAALEEGAQVVVGTPGRVLDHLRRRTLDPSNIRIFVLDEADEMLSMGFAKELHAIIETLPKERQGLYFSATIPPDVERLANNHLRDPEYITLSSDQIGALEIAHFVYLVREGDKRNALQRVLEVEDPESAIVFCNTKDETERVAEMLKSRGYDADWLNGDLDQRERERVMSATREGKLRFLVCTDVAARGIDISHLTHVINADFPESAEQYVHRTGRTGRAGKTGVAISMVGPKDVGHLYMLRLTYKIRPIERALPTQGELKTRAEADQIAFLADAFLTRPLDPTNLALARRLLTHESADAIIAGLLGDHLGTHGPNVVEESAEARRAKNPPPVAPPKRDEPVREIPPRTLRDGEQPEGGRPRGKRPPGRVPHASFTDWEPPVDADDDAPLFPGGKPEADAPAVTKDMAPSADAPRRDRDRGRGRRGDGPRPAQDRPRHEGRGGRGETPGGRREGARTDDAGVARPAPVEGRRRSHAQEAPPLPSFVVDDAPTSHGTEDEEHTVHSVSPFVNIFVNVGKRDGLAPADLTKMLLDLASIGEGDMGRIHVRDRMTFIAVRRELAERAMRALAGQVVGGRNVIAEPARDKN